MSESQWLHVFDVMSRSVTVLDSHDGWLCYPLSLAGDTMVCVNLDADLDERDVRVITLAGSLVMSVGSGPHVLPRWGL